VNAEFPEDMTPCYLYTGFSVVVQVSFLFPVPFDVFVVRAIGITVPSFEEEKDLASSPNFHLFSEMLFSLKVVFADHPLSVTS